MRISDWSSDVCSSDLVNPRAGAADFLGRGHDGLGIAQPFSHGIAARHMPERAVLQLACAADDSSLAEAGDTLRVSAQHVDEALRKIQPQRLQLLHIGLKHVDVAPGKGIRSEEHTSELQSLMRISYAVFCLTKKNNKPKRTN